MTLDACAALVERGDPDRFLTVRAAPPWARELLLPLYAFNLEVARAPWVTQQPMVAEMRLQWWRDAAEAAATGAAPPRAHEVAGPFHRMVQDSGLPADVLDALVAARRWDCWSEPFADSLALTAYLEETSAGLMWLAGRALGAPDGAEPALRAMGWAAGLAAYLRAVPELQARGRHPLPPDADPKQLAQAGLGRVAAARAARRTVPREVLPAVLPAWQAEPILRRVVADAALVRAGGLDLPEFTRRGRLLWQVMSGRW